MRDGNVYITERPKQKHNTPIFREDNSTLTLGRDGKYYFCFILPEAQVKQLPDRLVHQALSIAQKVERQIIQNLIYRYIDIRNRKVYHQKKLIVSCQLSEINPSN